MDRWTGASTNTKEALSVFNNARPRGGGGGGGLPTGN